MKKSDYIDVTVAFIVFAVLLTLYLVAINSTKGKSVIDSQQNTTEPYKTNNLPKRI